LFSGGVQQGRIVNFTGSYPGCTNSNYAANILGVFYPNGTTPAGAGGTSTQSTITAFKPARQVLTGPDVAGTNLAVRYWRRIS